MFSIVASTTLNLLLFRAGPEDFPYVPALTRVLVPLAALINYALLVQALPPLLAMAMALAVVMATGLATRTLLRIRGVEARFMQTFHSLLMVNSVLTMALWLPFSEIAPQLQELSKNPEAMEAGAQLKVSGWAALMMNALNIWNFVVNAHIFRRSANFGFGGGLLVAMLVAMAVLMFVLFFATFASAVLDMFSGGAR